jgi:polyisoprenyl-teichoic acid--peptidoglycan teichoic acid transferase
MQKYLNWKKILLGLSYAGIFIAGFLLSYASLTMSKIFVKNPVRNSQTSNVYSLSTPKPLELIEPEKQKKGTYNILLLGYGGGGHSGGGLTDSIIVLHADTSTKKITFISVPRDLWVTGNHKINSAATTGFNNMGPVVTSVTGLPINYFVATNFNGITKIIDDLGGITANTPTAFEDKFYPLKGEENNTCGKTEAKIQELKAKYSGYNLETQFTCRYEDLKFNAGPVNLDGKTALKYSRSRHGDSDFGRSARQFAVLEGVAAKLISAQAVGKFDNIVDTISNSVKTDLDAGTIKSLIQIAGDPKAYTFNKIQITTDNFLNTSVSHDGQFTLVPKAGNFNFSEIKNYITSQI